MTASLSVLIIGAAVLVAAHFAGASAALDRDLHTLLTVDPAPGNSAPSARRPDALCRCRHNRTAHEHYRTGSDCSLCDAGVCTTFVAAKPQTSITPPTPVSTRPGVVGANCASN